MTIKRKKKGRKPAGLGPAMGAGLLGVGAAIGLGKSIDRETKKDKRGRKLTAIEEAFGKKRVDKKIKSRRVKDIMRLRKSGKNKKTLKRITDNYAKSFK